MKYKREVKVALLAMVSLFLLYFGFNFLKGVNVFKPVHEFYGQYTHVDGLVEQAKVIVKGYKVGQVDKITYDFSKDSAFLVSISINKDIRLPRGTKMALVSDGLLGGMAVELLIPVDPTEEGEYQSGEFLPTIVVPGLLSSLEGELMGKIGKTIGDIDSLVLTVNDQLADGHVKAILENADAFSADLKRVSSDLNRIVHNDVPGIVANADTTLSSVKTFATKLEKVDIDGTMSKVDNAVAQVNDVVAAVKSDKGTLGKLLYDSRLYNDIDSAIVSVDSLVVDLKANPKRYVHFSLFGARDKKKK